MTTGIQKYPASSQRWNDTFADNEEARATPDSSTTQLAKGPERIHCNDCHQEHHRRNIVLCADGTWNLPDGGDPGNPTPIQPQPTNIAKIAIIAKHGVFDGYEQVARPFTFSEQVLLHANP